MTDKKTLNFHNYMQIMNPNLFMASYTNFNSKWIKGLNVKKQTETETSRRKHKRKISVTLG